MANSNRTPRGSMNESSPLLNRSHSVSTAIDSLYDQDESVRRASIAFNPAGDDENPLDWPKAYKWGVVALLASMSFTT
jgi:hypothetical protein